MDYLKISLRALDPQMVAAWRAEFADIACVECRVGSILDFTADAIVSPAELISRIGIFWPRD